MLSNEVISNEVSEIRFGLYSDDEIRALSICKIESPVTFDTLGNALTGGLYDELMGPQYQYSPPCKTCGDPYMHCPGHPGRIELCVPVYHPLLFKSLVFLLRSKCASCSKFRMSEFKTRVFLVKMKLTEMGHDTALESLDAMLAPSAIFESSESSIEKELAAYEAQYDIYLSTHSDRSVGMHTTTKLNDLIEQFKKAAVATKRCENCKAYSPGLRKDGFTKIFEKPLSKKLQKSMDTSKLDVRSALEQMPSGSRSAVKAANGDSDSEAEEAPSSTARDSDDSDDSDDNGKAGRGKNGLGDEEISVDKYLTPIEVEARVKLLWASETDILDFIFLRALLRRKQLQTVVDNSSNNKIISKMGTNMNCSGEGWKLFFLTVLLVPPNRFRPPADMGDMKVEHPQNLSLNKVLVCNEKIQTLKKVSAGDEGKGSINLSRIVSTWIDLQNSVNCYMDSAKDPNPLGNSAAPPGIRQLMERKEGLFRKNMMGKRVNFCCRSVLSPDPFIGSNEIGIPVQFAKSLHYPTPVTSFNIDYMRQLVQSGPHNYPGANALEYPNGKVVSLDRATQQQRDNHAELLVSTPGIKVHRHLLNGDPLLVNRQPTLHKPGIMAHRARVLEHVKEQTIRMHYANCSSYNADFDGDEINCHFVQSELARAEANVICNNDNQYIVPTSGAPLRGLIQDHIASGVKLTCRDTFLNKEEFQQLLYVAISGLPGTELAPPTAEVEIPPPAILKPVRRWTGKQVVSALINHMCRPPLPPLHLDGKTRTPPHAYGASSQEHVVVFRYGELLCGVLDKAAVGSTAMGIIHAVHELYGPDLTGRLLTAFGRVFTYFLQAFSGITCGIADLTLRPEVDVERRRLLDNVSSESRLGLLSFLRHHHSGKDERDAMQDVPKAADVTPEEVEESKKLLGQMLLSDLKANKGRVDAAMQGVVNKAAGDVIKACLPSGLESPFSRNNFALIVSSGAKGSTVNQSQISCFLGQQALEGQRVPLMISGKSLPSFTAYDGTARSGGFISDRFLTGVKPQEYYFHCMAGREGLIDTAVKTSRSGYLQRCLVKHLEELKVNYDSTVRDSDGNVIQFVYGEDGLDPTGASLLAGTKDQLHFLARNYQALMCKYGIHDKFLNQGLNTDLAEQHWDKMERAQKLAPLMNQGTGVSLASKKVKTASPLAQMIAKKSVVLARRKINDSLGWSRNNMRRRWEVAEVIKLRVPGEGDSRKATTYDLRYSDGHVEKRVPLNLKLRRLDKKNKAVKSDMDTDDIQLSKGDEESLRKIEPLTGSAEVVIPLIKAGLPDPAISVLPLDRSIGAMSERMHKTIVDYNKNPETGHDDVVTPESLELLVGVKYMRALACPGEAVGCVAAQSIGEPSTQMTLNTFHLAGHGAANVTLGIPRMREIIMTASKTLKTPTMMLPLVKPNTMADAKALARKMSKLSLGELVHHRKGIEVGESIIRGEGSGLVSRCYRVKIHFESPAAIEKHFDVKFDQIVECVSKKLTSVLTTLIALEQRRNGEKKSANAISKFQERRTAAAKDSDDEGGEDNAEEGGASKKSSRKDVEAFGVDDVSDEEENGQSEDESSESGRKSNKVGKSTKADAVEYDDEDEEEEANSDSESKSGNKNADSDDESTTDKVKKVLATPAKPAHVVSAAKKGKRSIVSGDGITYSAHHGFVQFEMRYPASMRRFLLLKLVEEAANKTAVRVTQFISRAHPVPCIDENGVADAGVGVMTEGVNFAAAWNLSDEVCRHSDIRSNDINAILMTYGVEAARESIVSEIKGVFGVYGINVNFRHLGLIADFMTRNGGYTPMNRAGMWMCPSPLQQMSFETTCTFLTQAAQDGTSDNLESSSARIVAGCTPRVGTGCFDVMMPLQIPTEA